MKIERLYSQLKQTKEQLWRRLLRVAVPFAIAAFALAACSPQAQGTPTHIIEPTPIVRATERVIPPSPTATVTAITTTTSTSYPSPTATERPMPIPWKCIVNAGSSSYRNAAIAAFNDYKGEKKIDESKGYTEVILKDSKGNIDIFIAQNGARISFVKELLTSPDKMKLLPCDKENVTVITLLIGGNDETDVSKPVINIVDEFVDLIESLSKIYPHALFRLNLPYESNADSEEIVTRRNKVDELVMERLRGKVGVEIIQLTPKVKSAQQSENVFLANDPWHADTKFIIRETGIGAEIPQVPTPIVIPTP